MANAVYGGVTRSGRGGAVLVVYTAVDTNVNTDSDCTRLADP